MIKLAIIHFPKGIRIDARYKQLAQARALTTSPYLTPATKLPDEYTVSFIDLTLPSEHEQEFLRLVRQHQEAENGRLMTTQISLSTPPDEAAEDIAFAHSQAKALRGLTLMSQYIHSLPATHAEQPKGRNLTNREANIMALLCQGLLDKEIASRLSISINTVKNHAKHIYAKLDAKNRTEAVSRYLMIQEK